MQEDRKTKIVNIVFLFIAGAILITPIVFFNYSGSGIAENRNLAPFPKMFNGEQINKGIFKELEKYVDDRFGLRKILIRINAYLCLRIFKTSPSDEVLIGKNNWLFYISKKDGDNLADFFKINKLSDKQLLSIKINLEDKANWCKANGIEFLFLIPPNKHSIVVPF